MPNSSTANQAGSTSQGGNENPAAAGSRMFTQEEVNAFLAKERRETEAKYKDFEKYKQVFEERQAQEEANKSELQKALDAQAAAEAV